MENEYIKTSNFKNLLFIFIILISLIACESKKKNIDFESRLSQNSNKDEDYLKFMNFIFAEKVNQDYTHCKKSAHFNDATSIFNLGAKYYKGEVSVLMNSVPPVLTKIVPLNKRYNKINNVYFLEI